MIGRLLVEVRLQRVLPLHGGPVGGDRILLGGQAALERGLGSGGRLQKLLLDQQRLEITRAAYEYEYLHVVN